MLTKAEQLYLTLGRRLGWSPERCELLVEEYQEEHLKEGREYCTEQQDELERNDNQ